MPNKQPLQKLSARHRAYAGYLAAGCRQIDAFAAAGFKADYKKNNVTRDASWLAAQPLVKELRHQIESENRIRLMVSVDSLVLEAEEARLLAIRLGRPSDAVAAINLKGKLLGLIKDYKTEVNVNLVPKPALSPMADIELSMEEWQRQWAPKELPIAPGAVKNNGNNGNGHG